jgi:hypothetical protein
MFGKAVGLCEDKRLGLKSLLDPGDWVVILISLDTRPGGEFQPGAMTDPRLVRCLAEYLAANRLGRRFTFATCLGAMAERCWTTDWGGAYDGISFRKVVDEATRRHPGCRFELLDLERDQIVEAEVPGARTGSKGVAARLRVPRSILQCDRLISVAPLRICPRLGARLTIGNYLGIAPRAIYGGDLAKLASHGSLEEALIDLYAYHPGDFAIAGGGWGLEAGPAQDSKPASVRHNLLIAGRNPLAVDAVAASVMGLDARTIDHLKRAEMEGFGIRNTDSIWVRGRDVEQVRRPYRRPAVGLP